MFRYLSCWNQQTILLPYFLKQVSDNEKCLYFKVQTEVWVCLQLWIKVQNRNDFADKVHTWAAAKVSVLNKQWTASCCGVKSWWGEFVLWRAFCFCYPWSAGWGDWMGPSSVCSFPYQLAFPVHRHENSAHACGYLSPCKQIHTLLPPPIPLH